MKGFGDVAAGVFFLAAIYVLVRPSSKGADLVKGFTDAAVAIVKTATSL